jgi:peptide/nickel transport system substrate-binding protein
MNIKSKKLICILMITLMSFNLSACGSNANLSQRYNDKSNTLYVGHVSASLPSTYMPWLTNQGISTTVSSLVFDTLFTFDDEIGDFKQRLGMNWEYVVDPELVPQEQDYLEVKVVLSDDIFWSDGEPVTAKDIYFTFDLAADFGRTNHAGALAWIGDLFHTYKKNSNDSYELVRQGVFYKDNPGSYTIDDNKTVYLHVKKVLGAITPLFTTVLMLPEHKWNVISPKNQLNSANPIPSIKTLYAEPVGSGPYTIDTANSNQSILLLNKRDNYHLKDSNSDDLYKVDTIKIQNYLDINVAINALKQGDIDVINGSIDNSYIDSLSKVENIAMDQSKNTFIDTLVINLNVPNTYSTPQRELLKDPILREAISLAINQEELIQQSLKGSGKTAPMGLVDEDKMFYNPNVKSNEFDLEKAKKLLEDNAYLLGANNVRSKDGIKLNYAISGSPGNRNTINYICAQLSKLGIEVVYEEGGSNAVKDKYYTGNFDMTVQGVSFDLTNVDMMMMAHFVTVGSSSNYGSLEDKILSAKIEEMRTTLSKENKYALIKEIQEDIASLNYKIPLYLSNIISIYRTDIFEGWTSSSGSNIFNTETLSNLKLIK